MRFVCDVAFHLFINLAGEGPRVSGTNVRPAALSESIASLTASRTLSSQTRDLLTEADRHGARYTPPHPRSKSDNNDPQDLVSLYAIVCGCVT